MPVIIHVDSHSGVPVYRQVIEQITQAVMTGQLGPGDQLESVAVLSKRIRVNPMTVSKAYSWLVQEGLLERRAGIGLFVADMDRGDRHEAGRELLEEAVKKAATLAFQLDMSEQQASELFQEKYKEAADSAKPGDKSS